MTIYTPSQNDKDKAKLIPEVVTGSLNGLADDAEEAPQPRLVQVTFFRRNGRSFYIHLLFALAVLVILACGALGAVVFYRHLHNKVYSGKCGTVYFDPTYHNSLKSPEAEPIRDGIIHPVAMEMDYVEEDISVFEDDAIESIHTPAFDEVRENYVKHDFKHNFTVIVDSIIKQCFVMKLNKTAIAPPTTVIELLNVFIKTKPFFRRARVIKLDFEVKYPLRDLNPYGTRVVQDCAMFPTFWLEKRVSGVFKRSAEKQVQKEELVYAMMSNFKELQTIYKVNIVNFGKKTLAAPAA